MRRIKYSKSKTDRKLPFFTLEASGKYYEVKADDPRGVISRFRKNFLDRKKVFASNNN